MKNVWKESWALVFKRGNIWALAIGVLVGGAFGAVVNALANDIIMQAIAKTAGVKGIESLVWGATSWNTIPDVAHPGSFINTTPIDGIKYGKFLAALIAMFIMVFFLVVCTFISLLIWRSVKKRRDAKIAAEKAASPVEPVIMQPTTEELILEELRKLNASNALKTVVTAPVIKASTTTPVVKKATTKKPATKKAK